MTSHHSHSSSQGDPSVQRIDRRDGERGQALPLFVLMLIALLAATGLVVDVGSAWAAGAHPAEGIGCGGHGRRDRGGQRWRRATPSSVRHSPPPSPTATQPSEVQVNIPPTSGKYAPGAGKDAMLANDCSTRRAVSLLGRSRHHQAAQQLLRRHHRPGLLGRRGPWRRGRWHRQRCQERRRADHVQPGRRQSRQQSRQTPKQYCNPQDNKCSPNNDFPLDLGQFNWTTFCITGGNCNVNTNDAVDIIDNEGFHTTVI